MCPHRGAEVSSLSGKVKATLHHRGQVQIGGVICYLQSFLIVIYNACCRIKWPNDIYYGRDCKIGGTITMANCMDDDVIINTGSLFILLLYRLFQVHLILFSTTILLRIRTYPLSFIEIANSISHPKIQTANLFYIYR